MQTRILAIAAALAVGTSGACYAGAYNNDFSAGVGAASLRGCGHGRHGGQRQREGRAPKRFPARHVEVALCP